MAQDGEHDSRDLIEVSERWGLGLPAPTHPEDLLENGRLFEEIVRELTRRVEILMTRDPRKFTNDLYRLDVSEARIKDLLRTATGVDVYEGLARLILKRELQKAKTRREYSST